MKIWYLSFRDIRRLQNEKENYLNLTTIKVNNKTIYIWLLHFFIITKIFPIIESDRLRKIIVQRIMFPARSTNDEIIKNIDANSASSTDSILNFQRSFNRRPGFIDTPYRESYATTPFSHDIEKLMMAPQKLNRKINPQPYQMLAFCNDLTLKVNIVISLYY